MDVVHELLELLVELLMRSDEPEEWPGERPP